MSSEALKTLHNCDENLKCFECGTINSSWACTEQCVCVCIDCAHALKSQCGDLVRIKSLLMASWTTEEIAKLQIGGNSRLKSLLLQYGIPKDILLIQKYTCRAVEYKKWDRIRENRNFGTQPWVRSYFVRISLLPWNIRQSPKILRTV